MSAPAKASPRTWPVRPTVKLLRGIFFSSHCIHCVPQKLNHRLHLCAKVTRSSRCHRMESRWLGTLTTLVTLVTHFSISRLRNSPLIRAFSIPTSTFPGRHRIEAMYNWASLQPGLGQGTFGIHSGTSPVTSQNRRIPTTLPLAYGFSKGILV